MCLTLPVLAHHSHGNYDVATWTVMEGTVKQVIFIVPHSIIYLDVKGQKGEPATWALEATNPQGIFLRGVKKRTCWSATRSRCGAICFATAAAAACSVS